MSHPYRDDALSIELHQPISSKNPPRCAFPPCKKRYVTSENATAAKDEYGVCVQALDGDQDAYAAGLCERVANCYWEEPREYVERARRYTDEQYEANDRAARDYIQSIVLTYGTLGFVLAVVVFAGCAKFSVRRYV